MITVVLQNHQSKALQIVRMAIGAPVPFGFDIAFVGSPAACARYVEQNGG